jgi:CRP/FNR family transcriptional regulator, cyclic AMP receptor protein
MARKSGATAALADHGWLAFTSPRFRAQVLSRLRVHELRKGDAVYNAGDPPGGLWAVVKGAVEIEWPPEETAPHLLYLGTPGLWFGEAPLIVGNTRLVTVIASRPSTLATLPLSACHAILEDDPSAWRWIALMSVMTTELSIGFAADVLLRDPTKRTAAVLLRLAGVRNRVFAASKPSPIYLSQDKLGQLANLSRNSIGPILRRFVARGCIRIRYGAILITDGRALSQTIAG